jgi:hypothetical protein
MTLFGMGAVSPWLAWSDHTKFGQTVDNVQGLDITTIAGCHTPVIEGQFIEQAFETVRAFPLTDPPPMPDQSVLDQIVAATALPPA